MKIFRTIISAVLVLWAATTGAQEMQEGFTYLETGKYDQAEQFFKTVLEDYPENKTARLCYGRAVGLSGNAPKAKGIFTQLLEDFPSDFEIQLNFAESLLWNKNFSEAKPYYKNLTTIKPESFPALLGYANTLSNLKEYKEALVQVDKALIVSPKNQNALTSKKYIYLGYAYQNQQAQQYEDAERLLDKNIVLLGEDKETLLNLANLYLIMNRLESAKETYKRLEKNPEHKLPALNGLSLVSHLEGKEKKALALSELAYGQLSQNNDPQVNAQTTERYVQALIWNSKYNKAEALISSLIVKYPNANWVLALRATLQVYKSNFKPAVTDYNQIIKNDSTSFDGNLGKANALKAIGAYDDAYHWADNTLSIYNNQKDALNFIGELDAKFTPILDVKGAYTFDNGENKAYALTTSVTFPVSTKLSILGAHNYRITNNDITNNEANSNDVSMGMSYQLLNNVTFKGIAGLTIAQTQTSDYTQLLADFSFAIKPAKLQNLDIGYKREIQNFNADLLEREIVQNNYYANYNLSTNFNLGWFTQFFYTSQNDDNTRSLLFTSLYYNLLKKPALKVGLNYQYITFKDQVPTIYFSPERFNAGEVFLNLIKDEVIAKPNEWFYELTAATGLQYIEDGESQSTYRFNGKLGYKFSKRAAGNIFGTHSNIASATAAGFTFTEIGIRFKWLLFDQPRFR